MNNPESIQTGKPKKFQLKIDDKVFISEKPELTRKDILQIADKTPACRFEVYVERNPHKQLTLLEDGQISDLTDPGIEKFITKFINEVSYDLSDESFKTTELTLTPNQILTKKFGSNAGQYYLKQIVGQTQVSYKEKPNEPITICPDSKFIYIFTGPMTVS